MNIPRQARRASLWMQKHWIVSALALLLGTCVFLDTRSVSWEEEVPLNTGETIIVRRSGTYEFHSFNAATGHMFFYSPMPRSTIEFTYRGKRYRHTDSATLFLLAIDPAGVPSLVADARQWSNQHGYPCTTPYYVQFRPDASGLTWSWPGKVETWLYNVPTNLTFGLISLGSSGMKVTARDRDKFNASLLVYPERYRTINPGIPPENCVQRQVNGK